MITISTLSASALGTVNLSFGMAVEASEGDDAGAAEGKDGETASQPMVGAAVGGHGSGGMPKKKRGWNEKQGPGAPVINSRHDDDGGRSAL